MSVTTMKLSTDDVVLVLATDVALPDEAKHWPVRVLRGADVQGDLKDVYLCGLLENVQDLLGKFKEPPLGVFVDRSPEDAMPVPVELMPELAAEGFSMKVYERAQEKVCAHHLETIQEMILRHAKKTPNKPMLVFHENTWTYQQSLSMANSLAEQIAARGYAPKAGSIALLLPVSDMCSIVYLGLFAAGYAVHVVDANPVSRNYKLSVNKSQAMICNSDFEEEPGLPPLIYLDQMRLDTARPVEDFHIEGGLDDIAFVEYTSGSTGRPKSVATVNGRIAHWIKWREFHFPLAKGNDVVAQNLFHPWYWHIVPCCGGTSVVYPTMMNHDVSELVDYVGKHGCTKLESITPGLISAILQLDLKLPESLQLLVNGGEACTMLTCKDWHAKYPNVTLWNNLATTETGADVSFCLITPSLTEMASVYAPISDGILVWHNDVEVIDNELVITGLSVCDGYLPPTVSDKFTLSPCRRRNRYRTGDRVEWKEGKLCALGRIDSTVKVRGYRVDLGGLEAAMNKCEAAKDVTFVLFRESIWGVVVTEDLMACKKFSEENFEHNHLIVWLVIEKLPYTLSAKRDRQTVLKMLEENANVDMTALPGGAAATDEERRVADVWRKILGRAVGREETWLQAGGHSLNAMTLARELNIKPAEVFAYPTVEKMAAWLYAKAAPASPRSTPHGTPQLRPAMSPLLGNPQEDLRERRAAVIGLSARVPGASSARAFWAGLKAGKDMISDLQKAGPEYIPRKGTVPDEGFDCGFWNVLKEQALGMDVAQRVMLEVAYEALEDAGFDPFNVPGRVGVVVCGGGMQHYTSEVLGVDLDECRRERPDEYFTHEINVDKDYLATTVSYKLNLHGPSETVQTACSSAAVAVVRAVQLLRLGVCDYVLCGGVSFSPDAAIKKVDGMIWAPEGVCRPFADDANGTVNADGCGMVLLTRLDLAEERREWIYATVLGVATNNDGSRKAAYSAPSHEGQVEVIREAMADASVTGEDIDYVEAHGTGTRMGDPIEVAALVEALGNPKKEIKLGSVKGNIGHMNTAAGIPGFIKVVEMLWRQEMVPTLHGSENPNSLIDWADLPLRLPSKAEPWAGRVASLSSFGIGGTNAHIVLGASPLLEEEAVQPTRTANLFLSSAKNVPALREGASRLGRVLEEEEEMWHPNKIEATLLARPRFVHRTFALRIEDLQTAPVISARRPVVLLFPGQGAAYPGMGSKLEADGLLAKSWTGVAPKDVVEASLEVAKKLKKQGLQVEAVFGHSVGEWAAAAFAGVVSVPDAVRLAKLRGDLMEQKMEKGCMISVRASKPQVAPILEEVDGIEVACENGLETVVLAGPLDSMEKVQAKLDAQNIAFKKLQTAHAFHTKAVEPILKEYGQALESVEFSSPSIPVLSNVTGDWHTKAPTTAQYWVDHLRQTVRFSDNLKHLQERYPSCLIVEVGPTVLAGVVRKEAALRKADWQVVPTMREKDEVETYLQCLGNLWAYTNLLPQLPVGPVARTKLPTYSWQRDQLVATTPTESRRAKPKKTPKSQQAGMSASKGPQLSKKEGIDSYFYALEYEKSEVSQIYPKEAALVLDGDDLPAGLPAHCVRASADRAVTAAATSGVLLYVGSSTVEPSVDDTTQEELALTVGKLVDQLAKAKAQLEVFFILKRNRRYAGLWGMLRCVAKEHPELRIRRLLLEEGASLILPAMAQELLLRPDGAYAPRLCQSAAPPLPRHQPATYRRALVTGGLRGLGVKVAEWLLVSGRAATLVIVGRNEPTGEAAEIVKKLQQLAPVEVRLGDVSRWADVQSLPDCDLVVHVAGNVKDGLLIQASADDVHKVLAPKVQGSIHLKRHYPNARLLGFSSSSGVFGSAAQGTYAFANTFLDSVMPSVQWGGWAEVGMAKDLNIHPADGERFLPVAVGLECLGRVLDNPECEFPPMVLDCDWPIFRHNVDQFTAEDPLLASIEALAMPNLLGDASGLSDSVHGWEMVIGGAGARHNGTHPAWEVCQQHVVGNAAMFPATAFVSLAVEAASSVGSGEKVQLTDVKFLRPLDLATPRRLTTTLLQNTEGVGGNIRFSSRTLDDSLEILHCTCNFNAFSGKMPARIAIESEVISPTEDLYCSFATAGFHYGPRFRTSDAASSKSMACCTVPENAVEPFPVHPATLDAALHLVSVLHPLGCRGVPQAIRSVVAKTKAKAASARAVMTSSSDSDVQLLDGSSEVLCHIEGVEVAALDAPPVLQLRQRHWSAVPPEPRGMWLLRDSNNAPALALPQTTSSASDEYQAELVVVEAKTWQDVTECRARAQEVAAQGRCWVVSLEAPFAEAAAAAAVEVGAQAVVGQAEDIAKIATGLGVTASLVRAKSGQMLVESLEPAAAPAPPLASDDSDAYAVHVDPSQGAKGAKCYRSERRSPASDEVEVRARVWALNFRDVLVAVGAIPQETAGKSLGIGGECYGEVVGIGSDVKGVCVGDKVVAVPPDGMGSFVTVDRRWVLPAPGLSAEDAVSGTMVYATAWLGLHWMARIQKGDRVLIHSAAGGVGLSAVHLCLRQGCSVYVTASTKDKRDFLTSLGVAGAFDSRNPAAFEEGIRKATDGEGVDVVLNSLSGEAIKASLRSLRAFGRFIEIGKRDQYEDTRLGLNPFLEGLTYAAAHLDVLMLRYPDRCRKLLEEVWEALPSLPRLPTKSFGISELPQALEYFSKGVHIGKVLVSTEGETPVHPTRPNTVSGPQLDPVTQALRVASSAREGAGGIVCVPQFASLASPAALEGARIVVTKSRAVAALTEAICPECLCVELAKWEPIKTVDPWLLLAGQYVAVEEEKEGDLREWLMEVVQDMAGSITMEQTFEAAGLDSLALISLARRISAKVGKSVSVVDLYDHPTPQRLLDSFGGGGPRQQLARPKVVCLHGFRSNREAMQLWLAPFITAVGFFDWVFINSPRQASGPPAPKTLREEAFEWWGEEGGSYETGWLAPHYGGLEATLPAVKDLAPTGIVGFSQGGGVAALVDCAWVALFSAVLPPGLQQRSTPSFQCWDPEEDYVSQCIELSGYFSEKEMHHHRQGHVIPQDEFLVKRFAEFAARQKVTTSQA
eukprot:TRINITY_DN80072_c0_g1_i1.p1 TRINITY_DN80072_c0_g1~~TRINITY_DN80072_c0_g1_i1.p1  ORF type:complete len:3057 (-),score=764.27 TRINITY_DN80072_c0_g1_i1:103-9273(-)